jgi:hypothetical protein
MAPEPSRPNGDSPREKAAAARVAQARSGQRRRAIVILSSVVALAIVAAVVALVLVNRDTTNKAVVTKQTDAQAVMSKIASVPAATLDTIGVGSAVSGPQAIQDTPLTGANGKPQLLYIGAEFCPYCAAERWAMAVALSRFGTLSGTTFTASGASPEIYPSTSTLDFKNATFTSKYLDFAPIENEDRNHQPLQKVSAAQDALWVKYEQNGTRSYPFLDFGNRYVMTGPTFLPDKLAGLSQTEIASQLADPTSDVAKGIDGAANIITATLCTMTDNQPASVCASQTISRIQTVIKQHTAAAKPNPGSTK